MLGGQRPAEDVVVGEGWQADARDGLNREDYGDAAASDPAKRRTVTESGCGHNDGVDPTAEQVIEDALQACRVVLRVDDQRHQSRGLQPVRYSPEHQSHVWICQIAHHHGHRVGPAALQSTGHHVFLVAHAFRDRLDPFSGHDVDLSGRVRIEGSRDRRVVHARRACDILEGHDRPLPRPLAPTRHAAASQHSPRRFCRPTPR